MTCLYRSYELNQADISIIDDDANHAMDIDEDSNELPPTLIKLCIEDLMSPQQNEMNKENMTPHAVNRSLYSEISSLKAKSAQIKQNVKANNAVCATNLLPKFEDCHQMQRDADADLKEAIQCAIRRRKSLDPQRVINTTAVLNKSMQSMNSICSEDHTTTPTTILSEIKQLHRFIQFKVDVQQTSFENLNELLNRYVSKLQQIQMEVICHQTAWVNKDQCTFYLMVNCKKETKEWTDIFLEIADSQTGIRSNRHEKVLFSQYIPQ